MVPLWLLDVDGVLNAVARRPDPRVWGDWRAGFAVADGVSWPIRFSPSAMREIRALHDEGLVEIRWLTTWRNAANVSLGRLVGLPEFAVEDLADSDDRSTPAGRADVSGPAASHGELFNQWSDEWWKFPVVRDVVAREGRNRPLVWTDDDLRSEPDVLRWLDDHVGRALLIAPNPETGLTAEHLAAIRAFCAGTTSP